MTDNTALKSQLEEDTNQMIQLNNPNDDEKNDNKDDKDNDKSTELSDDMFRSPNDRCEIGSQIFVNRVADIDLVAETFSVAFDIEFQWAATKEDYEKFKSDEQSYLPSYVPRFMFPNGTIDKEDIQIQNDNQGYRVVKCGDRGSWNEKYGEKLRYPILNICLYKIAGTFTERFELKSFPFDIQDLQINIECIDDAKKAIFTACHKTFAGDFTGFLSLKYSALQEYKVHPMFIEYGINEYSLDYAYLTIRMKIERNYNIYFWKIALFVFVTTGSTLFAFSMDPIDDLPDRYGFVVTLLLTAVAFQFVVATELPKLPYLTLLDEYIMYSFIFLFSIMFMMGIIPTFGSVDTVSLADRYTFIGALVILALYHIYIAIKIIIVRKYEVKKIKMDGWDAIAKGYEDKDGDDVLNATFSESVRMAPKIWDKYIDPKQYQDCTQRKYES